MSKISNIISYPNQSPISGGDYLIGTSLEGLDTKTFLVSSISDYILSSIVKPTLQAVTDEGNITTTEVSIGSKLTLGTDIHFEKAQVYSHTIEAQGPDYYLGKIVFESDINNNDAPGLLLESSTIRFNIGASTNYFWFDRNEFENSIQSPAFKTPTGTDLNVLLDGGGVMPISDFGFIHNIVAGTDITIDVTDPQNPIINSTAADHDLFVIGAGGITSTLRVGAGASTGFGSTISGGSTNSAIGDNTTVGGGFNNTAVQTSDTVSGGSANSASGEGSTVGGGTSNTSSAYRSAITGGTYNITSGGFAYIGGGSMNVVSGDNSSILGGYNNIVNSSDSSILGGYNNTVGSYNSSILGGNNNSTSLFDNVHISGSNISADRANTTFVENLSIKNIPTSSVGLPAGSIWNNAGVLNIV
jgi:hypothetical protein